MMRMVSSDKVFLVIAYDVASDRRRTRLHKKLRSYGTPVQYSLFECLLDRDAITEVRTMVEREVTASEDSVRYYTLCEAYRRRIATLNGRVTLPRQTIVV